MNKFYGCDATYEESSIVIFGAPYDGTASFRPGSRFAPNRVRLDSENTEIYSPYLDRSLTDFPIHDFGDVEVALGQTEKTLDMIYQETAKFLEDGKKTMMIGGEHLVSLPVIQAHLEHHPDLRVIHFDAHTDLRDSFLGEELSHATVLKKVADQLSDHRLYSFGIRSGVKEEFEYAKQHQYLEIGSASTIPTILNDVKPYPIYITIDVDVLDPSLMSGTGTPEPGGLTFKELLQATFAFKGFNIVGIDIVELAPDYDHSGVSTATVRTLLREMLLLMA